MKKNIVTPSERAQKIQDRIFQQMGDKKRFELWVKFWQLGKALNPALFSYGRPARAVGKNYKNS